MSENISKALLNWYAEHGRDLPWRVRGAHPDPYIVMLSEFMLQQTGVKTVIPYFERFITRFPTVQKLAAADEEEIYLYWQGLGYYSRARSLHAAAQEIAGPLGGKFPDTRAGLLKLKGIGPYTAASILSLAFNEPETIIDGNVVRVICRLYNLDKPTVEIADLIRQRAEALTDRDNPADYASAIMDLGATVCTPKKPLCTDCPLRESCLAFRKGTQESIPLIKKAEKASKKGRVYLITDGQGALYIRRRSEKGLLSGLYEFPWREGEDTSLKGELRSTGLKVSHVFTHFRLELEIYTLEDASVQSDGRFVAPKDFVNYPFSTLMKKVIKTAAKDKLLAAVLKDI